MTQKTGRNLHIQPSSLAAWWTVLDQDVRTRPSRPISRYTAAQRLLDPPGSLSTNISVASARICRPSGHMRAVPDSCLPDQAPVRGQAPVLGLGRRGLRSVAAARAPVLGLGRRGLRSVGAARGQAPVLGRRGLRSMAAARAEQAPVVGRLGRRGFRSTWTSGRRSRSWIPFAGLESRTLRHLRRLRATLDPVCTSLVRTRRRRADACSPRWHSPERPPSLPAGSRTPRHRVDCCAERVRRDNHRRCVPAPERRGSTRQPRWCKAQGQLRASYASSADPLDRLPPGRKLRIHHFPAGGGNQ
jgi:hypothetical protein